MKLFPVSLTIAFFTLIFLTGCSDRESDNRRWFKGNLHTHSYWSDGDEFPEMIMDWYKDRGYDFVAEAPKVLFFSHFKHLFRMSGRVLSASGVPHMGVHPWNRYLKYRKICTLVL